MHLLNTTKPNHSVVSALKLFRSHDADLDMLTQTTSAGRRGMEKRAVSFSAVLVPLISNGTLFHFDD